MGGEAQGMQGGGMGGGTMQCGASADGGMGGGAMGGGGGGGGITQSLTSKLASQFMQQTGVRATPQIAHIIRNLSSRSLHP